MIIEQIGFIRTDFPQKFGIPRQSGRVSSLTGRIFFLPEYRSPKAVEGLENFSHLWVIWGFNLPFASKKDGIGKWSETVRPPKLGGNKRVGVFSTRSPNRPNPLGLSVVKIVSISADGDDGPVITVSGIDMADNTPIYDIKPYLPDVDSVSDAKGGFTDEIPDEKLIVCDPDGCFGSLPDNQKKSLTGILEEDPRPGYIKDENREYTLSYSKYEVTFKVSDRTLTVLNITEADNRSISEKGADKNA